MSVVMLPSGRFRAFARVRKLKDVQTFDREKDAQTWAEKTMARMRKGTWQEKDKHQPGTGMTITQAFAAYVESESWLSKAQTTRTSELPKHKPVIAGLGHIRLPDLTVEDVDEYIAARRKVKPVRNPDPESKLSGAQIRLEIAALSAVLNWAISKKKLTENVTHKADKPQNDRRSERLTDEDIGKFFGAPEILEDPKAYAFFIVLFTTGCRPGELKNAEKKWMRDQPPQIVVPRTKNEDPRVLVLPQHTYDMCKRIAETTPDSCKYVFATKKRDGSGYGPYNYRHPWDAGAKAAGIYGTGRVAYSARHELISKLFESTKMSDGAIAGISGHRSSAALWHYRHLRNEHQRPVMNALDRLISDAINREISPSYPQEGLQTGELITDRDENIKKSLKPNIWDIDV